MVNSSPPPFNWGISIGIPGIISHHGREMLVAAQQGIMNPPSDYSNIGVMSSANGRGGSREPSARNSIGKLDSPEGKPGPGMTRRRAWFIAAWLTVSTILNLIDRQTLSILAPFLRDQLRISVTQYSHIVAAFLLSYAVMYAVGGWFVDRIGERFGMAVCVGWWSICTMATGLVTSAMSLGVVRFLLGIGEPGNYPAALKATARCFSKRERGLPIAMFSSGSAVGNLLAAPLIASLTIRFGWRAAFFLPGALGMLWVAVWMAAYKHPQEEFLAVRAEDGARIQWRTMFRNRQVVGLLIARFISDPVSYFYAFWIPEYLKNARGFSLADIGHYAWIPYVAGAAGGMVGGTFSDVLIRRGVPPIPARLRVLYVAALFAPLGILTSRVASAAMALALMSIMSFVVYCWFINTAALIPDIASQQLTGSILGIVGSAGSASAFLFTLLVGVLVGRRGSYDAVFAIVGSVHLFAALILWLVFRDRRAAAPNLQEHYEASK